MRLFHVCVHPRPSGAAAVDGEVTGVRLTTLTTLAVPPESLAAPLPVTFDAAAEAFCRLPRAYFEPDGSFAWTSPPEEVPAWRVVGNLYDGGPWLQYVEIRGTCPAERLPELLAAFGRSAGPLMFQLVQQAVFLDEAEFFRFACEGE